jgi:hypothetical protein
MLLVRLAMTVRQKSAAPKTGIPRGRLMRAAASVVAALQ